MSKKTKTEFNNQWATSLNDLTSKSESIQKMKTIINGLQL